MDNTGRFSGRAAAYERYRTRYPAADILETLREWTGLSAEWSIADIGAGTGMLGEVFLEDGNEVFAVEPNEEMREACERLLGASERLHVINATAEKTTLEAASVEMVVAGRAMHWFEPVQAVAEFRRILKPSGWVALVSFGRSKEDTERSREYERLLVEHGTDYAYIRGGYRVHDRLEEIFGNGPILNREIHSDVTWDFDEFVGQAMSTSIAPLSGDAKHEGMQHALKDFFERYAVDGKLTVPMTLWINAVQLNR